MTINKETRKKRIVQQIIIIASVSLVVSAVILFIYIELSNNRAAYIRNYKNEQQMLTEQVSLRMKLYMESEGMDISEAIGTIINEVETSASRYWFFAENDNMLFVRDYNYSKLFSLITLPEFIEICESNGIIASYSTITVRKNQYAVGICAKEIYVIEKGRINQHNIYIAIPITVIGAIILVVLFYSVFEIGKRKERIYELEQEAIERNKVIDRLTNSLKRLYSQNGINSGNTRVYSRAVLMSLLDKIQKENIVPLTIIVIVMATEDRDRNIPYGVMSSVSNYINQKHIVAEIEAGIFTILLFNTKADGIGEMKDKIVNEWAVPLKKEGYFIQMGVSCIEDYNADVEKVFDLICKEVSRGTGQ